MACETNSLGLPWMTIVAVSATPVFVPATEFVDAGGVTSVKGWGEMRGKTGTASATPAVQLANDVRQPGAATAVRTALTSDGVSDPNANTIVATGGSKYIRGGWLIAATGGTISAAVVGGVIQLLDV